VLPNAAGYPPPPGFFVSADSKGLIKLAFVSAQSKGLTEPKFEVSLANLEVRISKGVTGRWNLPPITSEEANAAFYGGQLCGKKDYLSRYFI
jgi:hypothetical protein